MVELVGAGARLNAGETPAEAVLRMATRARNNC
jgi:hypothetical protein